MTPHRPDGEEHALGPTEAAAREAEDEGKRGRIDDAFPEDPGREGHRSAQ